MGYAPMNPATRGGNGVWSNCTPLVVAARTSVGRPSQDETTRTASAKEKATGFIVWSPYSWKGFATTLPQVSDRRQNAHAALCLRTSTQSLVSLLASESNG